MNLRYFALVSIFSLSDVSCYSAHRQPRLTTIKNANPTPQELVIPARYKVKSKPNTDPTIGRNIHTDSFPEVEYPTSIMESSKPYYLNVSPFSNDVKSSFKSLVSTPTKPTPTIIVNLKRGENNKENSNTKPALQNSDVNDATIAKGNKINSNDMGVNETVYKEPLTSDNYDGRRVETEQYNIDKQPSMVSPEEESDCGEMDYVVEIMEDLDEFISTIAAIETEIIDMSDTTTLCDTNQPKESVTKTSDVTSVNNESVAELNEGYTDSSPLFDMSKDSLLTGTSLTNEGTQTSFPDEMQGDSGSIGNDDNSSCMEQ